MRIVCPGCNFAYVHQRLPCSQCTHRDRRGFHKVERLGFCSDFPLFNCNVIRPAAAERWVTIDRVAYFELGDVCARFFHDSSDVVARNQWQMRAEFFRVFPAECERIGWIDAAGDHAHERFIVVRFWSLHLFNLEHIGRAVFVRDDGSHLWLFISARYAHRHDSESG